MGGNWCRARADLLTAALPAPAAGAGQAPEGVLTARPCRAKARPSSRSPASGSVIARPARWIGAAGLRWRAA